jgi:hypothetical protein
MKRKQVQTRRDVNALHIIANKSALDARIALLNEFALERSVYEQNKK